MEHWPLVWTGLHVDGLPDMRAISISINHCMLVYKHVWPNLLCWSAETFAYVNYSGRDPLRLVWCCGSVTVVVLMYSLPWEGLRRLVWRRGSTPKWLPLPRPWPAGHPQDAGCPSLSQAVMWSWSGMRSGYIYFFSRWNFFKILMSVYYDLQTVTFFFHPYYYPFIFGSVFLMCNEHWGMLYGIIVPETAGPKTAFTWQATAGQPTRWTRQREPLRTRWWPSLPCCCSLAHPHCCWCRSWPS